MSDRDRRRAAGEPASAAADQLTPQLPPGADPALDNKPVVTAGQGELTKLVVTPLIKGTGPAAPGQHHDQRVCQERRIA